MIWSAAEFFEFLTKHNKLAIQHGFRFCKVSGLTGFEEAVTSMQNTTAFVCVSDIAQGTTSIDNTPHIEKVRTVFLAMRHAIDSMTARDKCMKTMHELFRQFMTVLIKEKTRLQQNCIFVDERISFQEIDQYFFSGCAGAWFQIKVNNYIDLRFAESEWVNVTKWEDEKNYPKIPPVDPESPLYGLRECPK